jgi:hypothetical protein
VECKNPNEGESSCGRCSMTSTDYGTIKGGWKGKINCHLCEVKEDVNQLCLGV